jgi:hypothetical protein
MNTPILGAGIVLLLIGAAFYLLLDFPSCQGKDICSSYTLGPFYLMAIGLVLVGISFALGRNHVKPANKSTIAS